MKQYIGITVGPIYDTIRTTSTPAALWFASSMFSDITCRICSALTSGEVFGDVTLYTPYYDETVTLDDGVGKFHDRIIFSCEGYDDAKMQGFLSQIAQDTAAVFAPHLQEEKHKAFLKSYIQLKHIVLSEQQLGGQNCILAISPYLDALELMKTFPTNDGANPLVPMFAGTHDSKSAHVKQSSLLQAVTKAQNQLVAPNGNIYSIEQIAASKDEAYRHNSDVKHTKYFAVLQADGDKMGAFLQTVSDADLPAFSKLCLDYAQKAAEMVGAFGGTTIYAGGDDLLALAPIINRDGKTLFALCQEINEMFQKSVREHELFKTREVCPTISFGISIQYNKHPLYEALSQGATQLFGKAKTGEKNNMAINMQKHSGQSLAFVLPNEDYAILDRILLKKDSVHSIIYTLETFAPLVTLLDKRVADEHLSQEDYRTAFMNLFDNEAQKELQGYIGEICDIYYEHLLGKENSLKLLTDMLRLKKFLMEE